VRSGLMLQSAVEAEADTEAAAAAAAAVGVEADADADAEDADEGESGPPSGSPLESSSCSSPYTLTDALGARVWSGPPPTTEGDAMRGNAGTMPSPSASVTEEEDEWYPCFGGVGVSAGGD
jgi:hypothetical protein